MVSTKFSKRQHLLKDDDFKAVLRDPPFKASHKYLLVLAKPNDTKISATARLGLVIAKKNVRLAVKRNRIKRLIRESFRLQQHHLVGIDAIVLARRGVDQQSNRAIFNAINEQWVIIRKKARRITVT